MWGLGQTAQETGIHCTALIRGKKTRAPAKELKHEEGDEDGK
jgi:hypothetical protein